MKIIGATKYTLIVEMDVSELKHLAPSTVQTPDNERDLQHWTGREFAIRKAWDRLSPLLDNRAKLETIVGQLKAMGELLEPIIPEVEKLTGGDVDVF